MCDVFVFSYFNNIQLKKKQHKNAPYLAFKITVGQTLAEPH
jgi:hypothetical protein